MNISTQKSVYLGQSRASCCPRLSALPIARGTQATIGGANAPYSSNMYIQKSDHSKYVNRIHNVRAAAGAALAAAGK